MTLKKVLICSLLGIVFNISHTWAQVKIPLTQVTQMSSETKQQLETLVKKGVHLDMENPKFLKKNLLSGSEQQISETKSLGKRTYHLG